MVHKERERLVDSAAVINGEKSVPRDSANANYHTSDLLWSLLCHKLSDHFHDTAHYSFRLN